ncbi:MAG: serine/threonine protein kinase [Blastocatellia bacterium]|nr:serine/threonine protein kinase [Blastocatellia bacterium]
MMQCPKCHKVFQQDKRFCSFDGTALEVIKQRDDYIGYIIDNKYQLKEKIGEGTTGTIYKALHLQLDAPVAIKLMRRDLVKNPTSVERFRREAYAAMKIRHPNAIAVMDFGITSEDIVYVVMEFLVGMPLSKRLKEKEKLGFLEANHIIQQVCAVLDVAHSRGIVHRDLKPDNIFLHVEDGREVVKVVDFGIAKLVQSIEGMANNITGVGSVVGTPHYISPEQCTARNVDARSDIYSLGVILYRMLSGKLPFEGPTSMVLIYKQVTEPPKPLSEVAPEVPAILNAVVMRAMEKEPDRRQPDITTFGRELAAAVKAVTDQEFQKVFLNATDEDLEAAVLLMLDGSGSVIDSTSGKLKQDAPKTKGSGDISDTKPRSRVSQDIVATASQKILITPSPPPINLNGRFPECDLATVVHTLLCLEVTGSLLVYTVSGTAQKLAELKGDQELPPAFCSLYIERGNIERAKLGVRIGEEAFFQLLQMPVEGNYIFKPVLFLDELKNLEPIFSSGLDVWQEALSLRSELAEYKEIFPNLLFSLKKTSSKLRWDDKTTRQIAETVWHLIEKDQETTISNILAKTPCCNAKAYRVLTLLLSTGQIQISE